MFSLAIDTDGAAFRDDGELQEVARILRRVADKIDAGTIRGFPLPLLDINGNVRGYARFAPSLTVEG